MANAFSSRPPSLSRYACVVLGPETEGCMVGRSGKTLLRHVRSGGGMVCVTPKVDGTHADFFGRTRPEPPEPGRKTSRDTMIILRDLFPGTRGMNIPDARAVPRHPLYMAEDGDLEILAEMDTGETMLWNRRLGKGNVVVWNTDLALRRTGAGLLLQTILATLPVAVQCVVNAGVVCIDDFPAAFSDLPSDILREEFGLSFLAFLERVWLPDMLRLGKEFDLPYTFSIPFSYNNKTSPPFDLAEYEHLTKTTDAGPIPYPAYFARLISEAGELGFHGYNHLPLTAETWNHDPSAIREAIGVAMARWEADGLGPPPACYVPPMNQIDAMGLAALRQAVPSIQILCGSYEDSHGAHGDFGPDARDPGLFRLPRVTWGNTLDEEQRFLTVGILATCGLWTHMTHPDDILETESLPGMEYTARNADRKGWRSPAGSSILGDFTAWLTFIRSTFPWLRHRTASQAAARIRRHLDQEVDVRLDKAGVRFRSAGDMFVHLRIRRDWRFEPDAGSHAELCHRHRGDTYDLYTYHLTAPHAFIPFKSAPGGGSSP